MKKSLFLISFALLIGACSSDEKTIIEPENTDTVEIALSAKSLSIGVETKAPYLATTPGTDSNALIARVISIPADGDYSVPYSDGTMTFISADSVLYNTGASGNTYYPADGSVLTFSGLYPATGWTIGTGSVASASFNGSTDLMYAGTATGSKSSTLAPALTFNHLLTLLNLSVKAETEDAAKAWGNITSVTVASKSGLSFTMGANPTISFTGDTVALNFYKSSNNNAISAEDTITLSTTESELVAYSMPQWVTAANNSSTEYVLTVKSTNYPNGRTVNLNLMDTEDPPAEFTGSTQGRSFNISLNFQAATIMAKATITAWIPSGSASVDIQ